MKVTIDKNELYLDPEIIVKCKEVDGVIQDIISYIGIADKNMIGEIDGEMFFVPLNSIFYFESVDDCFLRRYRSVASMILLSALNCLMVSASISMRLSIVFIMSIIWIRLCTEGSLKS